MAARKRFPIPFFSSAGARRWAIASVERCRKMRFSIRRNLPPQSMSWAGNLKECSLPRASTRMKRAMVETWRTSWFEEGSRLLYIVPTAFVDGALPLSINPAPSQTVRVFVGRLEIVTPATEKAVKTAFATQDAATLKAYGRFLEPILATMIKREMNPAQAGQLQSYLNVVYSRLLEQNLGRN